MIRKKIRKGNRIVFGEKENMRKGCSSQISMQRKGGFQGGCHGSDTMLRNMEEQSKKRELRENQKLCIDPNENFKYNFEYNMTYILEVMQLTM